MARAVLFIPALESIGGGNKTCAIHCSGDNASTLPWTTDASMPALYPLLASSDRIGAEALNRLEDLRPSVGGSALSAQHQPTIVMDPAYLGANVVTMTCCNRCPLVQSYRALRRTSESERSLKPTRIYIFGNNRKRSRERLRRYITG